MVHGQTETIPVLVPVPADAAAMAATDIQKLDQSDQPFQRYLFVHGDRSRSFHGAFNYVLNSAVSHASILYRPPVVAEGRLIRIDLRRLWPREDQFKELFFVYEELARLDRYFNVTSELVLEEQVRVKTAPYRAVDGRTYDYEYQTKRTVKTGTQPALHLAGMTGDQGAITILKTLTQSQAPILRADQFLVLASSSYKLENGQYYRFRRVRESDAASGKSAEQLWLESVGVDYAAIQKMRSDQRIAKWRSNITGKPRAIEYFYSSSARPIVGPSLTALTRDFFDGTIKASVHPVKNLLNYVHDGTEAMSILPNGMVFWVLFNGAGGLVDVAPQALVSDREVPAPHTTNLQPPISCWRCHGKHDMWQPASNDAQGRLGARKLDFFDDESSTTDPIDTMDRLAGLYTGEMDEPLRIARNAHARAAFIVSMGMQLPEIAEKLAEIYRKYRYDLVTPRAACLELGWEVPEEDAGALFAEILPKLPANRFGVRPENPTIGTLRDGIGVNRDDWEQEYADAMLRVTIEAIRKQGGLP